jgi:hypothetical protein
MIAMAYDPDGTRDRKVQVRMKLCFCQWKNFNMKPNIADVIPPIADDNKIPKMDIPQRIGRKNESHLNTDRIEGS